MKFSVKSKTDVGYTLCSTQPEVGLTRDMICFELQDVKERLTLTLSASRLKDLMGHRWSIGMDNRWFVHYMLGLCDFPHENMERFYSKRTWISHTKETKPGDVVLFHGSKPHFAIYVGKGYFLSKSGDQDVVISNREQIYNFSG